MTVTMPFWAFVIVLVVVAEAFWLAFIWWVVRPYVLGPLERRRRRWLDRLERGEEHRWGKR